MKPARVIWTDASIVPFEVMSEESAKGLTPVRGDSFGWVLRDDDVGIVLALTNFDDGEYRQVTCIPRSAVLDTQYLEAP